jgi:formylglycine-generating enzyme required for sulfatase activity
MGASGSGKSSLVKSGLLSDLKIPGMIGRVALCRHGTLRPSDGDDLVATLASALLQPTALPELESLQYEVESLAHLLRGRATQVPLLIRQGLAAAGKAVGIGQQAEARLLLVIDQLEELFTRDTIVGSDRESFVAAIEALATSGLVWVVATLRSDFFDRLEMLPRLLKLSAGEARYLLVPPEPSEISQMIRQPAREAGVRFEVDAARGIDLAEVIKEAAVHDPGALPLLSFLLDQLWQARDTNGFLTFTAYESLGGLEGSLGRRANDVFTALPADVQNALPEVLRALVTVGPAADGAVRPATARSAPLSSCQPGTPHRMLIDALLDPKARLLVAHSDERKGAQIRVAHEALLSHWEAARNQIEKDARDLQLRARLEQAAQLWGNAPPRHRTSLLLQRGLPLDEARDLTRRWQDTLHTGISDYVEASRRAVLHRTLRLAALGLGAMLSVPLMIALVWIVLVWRGVHAVERNLALVRVPAGCFMMGSPDDEAGRGPDEGPIRKVCVRELDLGKFEVTQEEWQAVMLGNPSQYLGPRRPVENVSWDDVQQFIGRMNWFGSRRYRLPSEAEWEYAARAGTTTSFQWGPTLEPDACNHANINDRTFREAAPRDPISQQSAACSDGHYRTAPVGGRLPNGFGLFDMQGNVWEWVADEYHTSYRGAPIDGAVWGADRRLAEHVIRGGSWHSVGRRLRSAQREKEPHDYRIGYIGFRLAASITR